MGDTGPVVENYAIGAKSVRNNKEIFDVAITIKGGKGEPLSISVKHVHQPLSLKDIAAQRVATNLEKFPPGLIGILSESQWEDVVQARVKQKKMRPKRIEVHQVAPDPVSIESFLGKLKDDASATTTAKDNDDKSETGDMDTDYSLAPLSPSQAPQNPFENETIIDTRNISVVELNETDANEITVIGGIPMAQNLCEQ